MLGSSHRWRLHSLRLPQARQPGLRRTILRLKNSAMYPRLTAICCLLANDRAYVALLDLLPFPGNEKGRVTGRFVMAVHTNRKLHLEDDLGVVSGGLPDIDFAHIRPHGQPASRADGFEELASILIEQGAVEWPAG